MTRTAPGWLKPVTDFGPLVVFFAVYWAWDLLVATAALMAATAIAIGLTLHYERRVAAMPLVTAVVVGVFGALTLILDDEVFIKMKPTIVQALFAVVLLGGLAVGRPLLKPLLGTVWTLVDEGWRRLTLRFALFFAAMAVLNEVVWRTQSTDLWVTFKVFGIMALTFAFTLTQLPLLARYRSGEGDEGGKDAPGA